MSTQVALKLNQIKQWKNKLSNNAINDISDQIYCILGGTRSIIDHYINNARYLKLNQIDELHELFETAKKKYSKNKLQRKRKRANSHQPTLNTNINNILSQSSTTFIDVDEHQLLSPKAHKLPNKKTKMKYSKSMNEEIINKQTEYQPIFGSRSAEIAVQRQDKREKKRRGSGLEERMKMEKLKMNHESRPIQKQFRGKGKINNDEIEIEIIDHYNYNKSPRDNLQNEQSEMSDLSDFDNNDDNDDYSYFDIDNGYRLKQDKKRKYSISEHTDWESDNDELEIKQSNEYFNKLEQKYKKKKRKKKGKKDKKKLKKMMKLQRMAMEQMRKDKSNQNKQVSDNISNDIVSNESESIRGEFQVKTPMQQTNSTTKPGMDSPEFIAYFEKFMSENSSFYQLQLTNMNNDKNDYHYSEDEGIGNDLSDSEREYDSY